jgi:hypothetical protein
MDYGTRRTDDPLGYLSELTFDEVTAVLPEAADPVDVVIREHDGPAPPQLPASALVAVIATIGITLAEAVLGSHVSLDIRRPWVRDRGHVDLVRGWFALPDVPRADWPSWLDVDGAGGGIELWLEGLTAGERYVLDVSVTGWPRGSGSAFMVRSSAGLFANYPVTSGSRTQHLLGVLEPDRPDELVQVDPIDLELVSFHRARVTKV